MKVLYILLIMLITISLTSFQNKEIYVNDSISHSQEAIKKDTLMYTVYGMDCPGCEGGLEKQVNKIPSVKYSKANWVKQELIIVVKQDSILNKNELERRVKKANFTLVNKPNSKENEK